MGNVMVIPARRQVGNNIKKAEKPKLRVAAYCRVSTDSDEQATSYEAQIEHYTEFIQKNPEWVLAGIFADDGISGTNTKKRDEFNRMIDECHAGNIDMIITKSISRFARNTLDCLKFIRELKDINIPVYFEKESINTMDAKGEVLLTIMASLAQQESQSLSQNVKLGLQYRYQQGHVQVNHNRFLGYTKDADGHLVIDPEQAEIVRRIYREYLQGLSMDKIAAGLEADGILTGAGKTKWHTSTINKILRNEKYIGDALLQKTYVVDCITHKSKRNDDRPQYYVENNHPPIVSREVFDRVQTEMARRTSKRRVKEKGTKTESGKYSSKYALTDMLICGHCGTPYRRCTWVRKGEKKIVWRCISRLDYGRKYCPDSPSIEESVLQDAIADCVMQIVADESGYAALQNIRQHISLYFGKDDENSTAADEARAAELIQAITDAASGGEYTAEMQALTEELKTVKATIAEKKARQTGAQESETRIDEIMEALEHLKHEPITLDNQALRKLIDCIRVMSKDEIQIIFKSGFVRNVPLKQ